MYYLLLVSSLRYMPKRVSLRRIISNDRMIITVLGGNKLRMPKNIYLS